MANSYTTFTGSVVFNTDSASWAEPATAAVNVRGFPGGDSIAVSLGGQRGRTRSVACIFASIATYNTFAGMRGRQGTLQIDGWDTAPVSAVLKQASPNPPGADGTVAATAQFQLT